jgi:hypothetical protein
MAEVARFDVPRLAEMEPIAVTPDLRWRAEVRREMTEAGAALTGLDRQRREPRRDQHGGEQDDLAHRFRSLSKGAWRHLAQSSRSWLNLG